MMNLQFELLRLGISKIAGDLGISSYENIIPSNTVRRLLKCLKHENRTRRHRPRHAAAGARVLCPGAALDRRRPAAGIVRGYKIATF